MVRKKTAVAEGASVRESACRIDGARLTKIILGGVQRPGIVYSGEVPEIGDHLTFTLGNGVTYTGTVSQAVDIDGETLVEFHGGISPQN